MRREDRPPPRPVAGRYRLLDRLGRGGVGVVWRGRDLVLEREVAVKQVPFRGSGERQERALREARAAARLAHPGAATVYDVLEEDDSVFIVMELVSGVDLGTLVRREGPLDERRAAAMGAVVADVLAEAHRRGIVHRDVKPGNVLVGEGDRIKLTDFGIARLAGDPALTRTGVVIGTPAYMSPEQAAGRPAGPPTDVWGLGATLYYAVEGRAPFAGEGALGVAQAVVAEEPRPIRRAGRLAPVIARLLAKDPARRPAPEEVRAELAELAGEEAPALSPPAAEEETLVLPGPSSPRGRDLPRAGMAALWVLAVLGVLGLMAALGRSGPESPSPTAPPTTASPPTTGAPPTTEVPPTTGTPATGSPPGEDWVVHEGATYRVAVPADWRVRDAGGNRTDYVDPQTGAYLRVDWTDQPGPDPVAAWEDLSERFAAARENYREIRIEPTTYRGHPAAVWEFTYSEGGGDFHALDLGFVTGERGFALYFQTPADRWEAMQGVFERIRQGFELE